MSVALRRRLLLVLGAALALPLLLLSLAALRGALIDYPRIAAATAANPAAVGAFHVHSKASDGWGSAEEIAAAAKRAGLDFVVLTDHNVARQAPRFVEGVLLVFGTEVSTSDGHLLVLGGEAAPKGSSGAVAIDAGRSDPAAFVALAHPVQRKNPWRDWEAAKRVHGFERYSGDTFLRDALAHPFSRLLPAVGGWLGQRLHGTLLLATAQTEPLERFLALAEAQPLATVCAHDAHGYPPYEDAFRALGLQLSGPLDSADPRVAEAQLLRALRAGEAVCVFRGLGSGAGFSLEGIAENRTARVGDVVQVLHPAIHSHRVQVEVSGAGALLEDGRSVRLTHEGAVQIELFMKVPAPWFGEEWRPWIVPAPIRVLPRL